MTQPIVLASGSTIRRTILTDAGVTFQVERPTVDETVLKEAAPAMSGEELSLHLAHEKALEVSRRRNGVVIGADQILRFRGALWDKVDTLNEARARLERLRGEVHELVGGVVLARDGAVIDTHTSVSRLTMRSFSDAFLDRYLERSGDALLSSVGCYLFEGMGAQLFSKIDGDYFAILGLPLLPVLDMLRRHGGLDA